MHGLCKVYAWNMYGARMGYAWIMHGICMEYAWTMHGICIECAWNTHGICMSYAWKMHGMEYAWYMHGVRMEYAWHMHEQMHGIWMAYGGICMESTRICIEYTRNIYRIYETSLRHHMCRETPHHSAPGLPEPRIGPTGLPHLCRNSWLGARTNYKKRAGGLRAEKSTKRVWRRYGATAAW